VGDFHRKIVLFAATGLGVGYLPRFPGTGGTCLAIPLSLAVNQIAIHAFYGSLLVLVGITVCAIWLSGEAAELIGLKDPQIVVVDEVAGFLIANFLNQPKLSSLILSFILFRFFDIIKLFPAARAEKLPGGYGIVLDDLVAGAYTLAILRGLAYWRLV
jgi:phosphatidylglycerophosphatase A